jgi:hypothetical protein
LFLLKVFQDRAVLFSHNFADHSTYASGQRHGESSPECHPDCRLDDAGAPGARADRAK